MYSVNIYILTGVRGYKITMRGAEGVGELVEAAKGEREFGVEVERGGGEAAVGRRELSEKSELEAELSLAATALGYQLRDRVAGDTAAQAAVQDWAAQR